MDYIKTAATIRHITFEDLGCFESPLVRAGYKLQYHDVGEIDWRIFDELKENPPDLLVVLGGPIGVYEEDKYPFLTKEITLLQERLEKNLPTLGICLGAQLIAKALGERVYPGSAKEIGFAPIDLTTDGESSCLRHFKDGPVLHWHGDTFDLPKGATRLASTAICENQAFSYGRSTIAFQFHPEAGGPGFEHWLIGHAVELSAAGIDINNLRQDAKQFRSDLCERAELCIEEWLAGINSVAFR